VIFNRGVRLLKEWSARGELVQPELWFCSQAGPRCQEELQGGRDCRQIAAGCRHRPPSPNPRRPSPWSPAVRLAES